MTMLDEQATRPGTIHRPSAAPAPDHPVTFTRRKIDRVLIAFGVLGILNFSHGALFMIGAYLAFTFYGMLGLNFWLAVLLSTLSVAVLGAVLERFFLRRIYNLDLPFQLLLTFGFVLVFDDLVKMAWGGMFMIPPIPPFLSGSVPIFGRPFPIYNLFILVVGVAVAVGIWLLFDKTCGVARFALPPGIGKWAACWASTCRASTWSCSCFRQASPRLGALSRSPCGR